jgi:formylglycine-generating enzyme required for sulfatase activity
VIRDFGQQLISRSDIPALSQFKVVKAYQEITTLQHSDPAFKDFTQAAVAWMKSEKVNPELKSIFLLSHFGSNDPLYKTYRASVPHDQLQAVMRKIDEATNLKLFERFVLQQESAEANTAPPSLFKKLKGVFQRSAAKQNTSTPNTSIRALFESAKLESFEFQPFRFPEGGKRVKLGSPPTEFGRDNLSESQYEVIFTYPFEMQETPVTQLQWTLVMGENPSHFKEGGQVVKISGRDIPMNSNRPVELVSWYDAQAFIQKLNEMDPHYKYRLPTEPEWEYAARAGTETPYSFGSNPTDLTSYGWYIENSDGQTHDVASLKPNAYGLYDMHGNVSEWTMEPGGFASRMVRGGSWAQNYHRLRSASRNETPNMPVSLGVGFRLVRTPK